MNLLEHSIPQHSRRIHPQLNQRLLLLMDICISYGLLWTMFWGTIPIWTDVMKWGPDSTVKTISGEHFEQDPSSSTLTPRLH